MKKLIIVLLALALVGMSGVAQAVTYVEDFEAAFPAWESGWLGTNSNLTNYYGVGGGRGNNPDGLWIVDGDGVLGGDTNVEIFFNPVFGATLVSLNIDIATWSNIQFEVYDMSNNQIISQAVAPNNGAYTDPGTYAHVNVTSGNGISKFAFVDTGGYIEGYTSIDNVVVSTTAPLPGAWWLLGSGLLGLLGSGYRRRN